MNARLTLLAPWALLATPLIFGQAGAEPPAPPPVIHAAPAAPVAPPPTEQRLYGPGNDTLIARPAADAIVQRFRAAYPADRAPRIVVYVNRALVDNTSGLKLTGRTEHFEHADNTTKTSGDNTYQVKEGAAPPALADQQTMREIERLFGRVFRNAGAQLVDQKVAASLLPDQPGDHRTGDQAAKDRQALANVADIAIEILISSRNLTVPEVAGDATYIAPDIQATAIRLKDAAIIGQAAAADILGKGAPAGQLLRRFAVQEITEATALVLMEDMLTGAK